MTAPPPDPRRGPELEGGGNRGYAMLRRWAEAGTPLSDVTRASAV